MNLKGKKKRRIEAKIFETKLLTLSAVLKGP